MRRVAAAAAAVAVAVLSLTDAPLAGQSAARKYPIALLEPAPLLRFPSPTDSNSPAFWLLHRGVQRLVVFNSNPNPVISVGPGLSYLMAREATSFEGSINGSRWMEGIIADEAGRLYGYYHNEPAGVCPGGSKTAPRVGAARSLDGGRTWRDLGIVLAAPAEGTDCLSPNRYFAGGIGDFSVILDRSGNDLYFLLSTYGPRIEQQGVSAARMRWADRDAPQGNVAVWSDGAWRYPEAENDQWVYPQLSPFFAAAGSWHDRQGGVDAFWGPSVHWNTFLERYVMLLNRARDSDWRQEGIYLATSGSLEDPTSWTSPQKLLDGGAWYPQVMGLETGSGTDKLAGARARFFVDGESSFEIVFQAPAGWAVRR